MKQLYSLKLDENELIDFTLIAIHTTLEDYRLAFMINKYLLVSLCKFYPDENRNISLQDKHKLFTYDDDLKETRWEILRNKLESNAINGSKDDLFQNIFDQVSTISYIVPEKKKVDYFLKIHEQELKTSVLVDSISDMPMISMVFEVDVLTLKYKTNLIY